MPGPFAVLAETKEGSTRKTALEMLAEARRLADASGAQVAAVVLGPLASGEADRLAQHGADRVAHVDGPALASYAPEAFAEAAKRAVDTLRPEALFLAASAQGRDLAPRRAARLDVGLASDCVGFEMDKGRLVARRPIFAGKAFGRVTWNDARPMMATVRPNVFAPSEPDAARKAATETLTLGEVAVRARVTGFEQSEGETLDLTEANIIVSGGRAMQ